MPKPEAPPPRRAIPASVKREVAARAGGRCENCGAEGVPLQWEHRVPRGLHGANTAENIRLWCEKCHGPKTKEDVARIAKAVRQEKKSYSPRKPSKLKGRPFPSGRKQAIPSRPFPKKQKPRS